MRSINPRHFIDRLYRRGYEELGRGHFSAVLAKPGSDKVIKVNTSADCWLDYVLWAAKHGYAGNHAPRVYSFHRNDDGTYIAVVERMETTLENLHGTPKYSQYIHVSRVAHGCSSDEDVEEAEKVWPGSATFARKLRTEFAGSLDIHSGNYMLRKDGSLVCTDPVAYGESSATTPKRMRSRELETLQSVAS